MQKFAFVQGSNKIKQATMARVSQKHNNLPAIVGNGGGSNNKNEKNVLWQRIQQSVKRVWKHNKSKTFQSLHG